MTKLTLCDSDDEPLANGEFTAAGGAVTPTDKTLADYQGAYTGAVSFDGDDYDKAVISGTTLSLQEGEYSPNEFALTEDATGEKLVAVYTKTVVGTVTTIKLTFDDDGFTIDYVKTSSIGSPETATGRFTPSAPAPVTKYTVTYVKPTGVDGDSPAPVEAEENTQVTLEANPYTKTGWTFKGWAVTGYPALRAQNTKIKVTTDTTVTPVFGVKFNGALGEIDVLDNNTIITDGYTYSFTRSGDIVTIDYDGYPMVAKVNDAQQTYVLQDGMQSLTFTAANGTALSFDGFGEATLGTLKGTYAIVSNTSFTLTIGGATYPNIALEGEAPNVTINVKITVDGTEYVFGNAGTTNPDNPNPNPPSGNKMSDFAGDSEANGVWYGAATLAGANGNTFATGTQTNYKFNFYYGRFSGVDCYGLKRYYQTSSGSEGSTTVALLVTGDAKITDSDANNTTVYFKASGKTVTMVFSVNEQGKRQVVITITDNNTGATEATVTLVEMAA